jgi:phage FluMu gp28-like protein
MGQIDHHSRESRPPRAVEARRLILIASPTGRQSALFVHKVEQFVRKLGHRVRGDGDNQISVLLPNGSRIVGLPGTSEANIRGFSAASLLIIDEAARVEDELYYAARPILAVSGGAIWLLSTPWGKRGFFYTEWTHGGEVWERLRVPATECPRIPGGHLEEERRTMGDDWVRQEYLCEFVDAEGTTFDRDLVEAAFTDKVKTLEL